MTMIGGSSDIGLERSVKPPAESPITSCPPPIKWKRHGLFGRESVPLEEISEASVAQIIEENFYDPRAAKDGGSQRFFDIADVLDRMGHERKEDDDLYLAVNTILARLARPVNPEDPTAKALEREIREKPNSHGETVHYRIKGITTLGEFSQGLYSQPPQA